MKPLTSIVSVAIALIVCSCGDMQADYFCDNTITLDNGKNQPLTKQLTPAEKQALNAYVAEHTTWLNSSYITYAPEGITMRSTRVKINIRRDFVILSVRAGDSDGWHQYVKQGDASDAVLMKRMEQFHQSRQASGN